MKIAFRGRQNMQNVDVYKLRCRFVNYLRHRAKVVFHMRRDQLEFNVGLAG
jgi:hypothetical protein